VPTPTTKEETMIVLRSAELGFLALAGLCAAASGQTLSELVPPSPAAGARFGEAVVAARSLAVVGSPETLLGGSASGHVYTYAKNGASGPWVVETAVLAPNSTSFQDQFGYALAFDNPILVVGAPGSEIDDAGAAYVYRRESGAWILEALLRAPDLDDRASFGASVDVHSGRIIVGEQEEDTEDTPRAYFFRREPTGGPGGTPTWISEGYVFMPALDAAGQTGDYGEAVAIYEDFAMVGASQADPDGEGPIPRPGIVYVYRRLPEATTCENGTGDWCQVDRLPSPEPDEYCNYGHDHFGRSIAIEEGVALIGSYRKELASEDCNNLGRVYEFKRSSLDVWENTSELHPNVLESGVDFGYSVSLLHPVALVGRPGGVEFFEDGSNGWAFRLHVAGSSTEDDKFGLSVSLGNIALIGAPGAEGGEGRAYVVEED
jgi:hypothetical protein